MDAASGTGWLSKKPPSRNSSACTASPAQVALSPSPMQWGTLTGANATGKAIDASTTGINASKDTLPSSPVGKSNGRCRTAAGKLDTTGGRPGPRPRTRTTKCSSTRGTALCTATCASSGSRRITAMPSTASQSAASPSFHALQSVSTASRTGRRSNTEMGVVASGAKRRCTPTGPHRRQPSASWGRATGARVHQRHEGVGAARRGAGDDARAAQARVPPGQLAQVPGVAGLIVSQRCATGDGQREGLRRARAARRPSRRSRGRQRGAATSAACGGP